MTQRIVLMTGQEMSLLRNGQMTPLNSEFIARFEKNMNELENKYEWRSSGAGAQFTRSQNPFAGAAREQARIAGVCEMDGRLVYAVNFGQRCGLYSMDVDSPGRGESLIFSQMNQFIGGISARAGRMTLSVSSPMGRSSIALMSKDSADVSIITEGDVRDTDPSFSRDGRSIYYASAGLGRNEEGVLLAVGPSAILRLDMESGALSELPSDENYDYLRPREAADGTLYCLRRPHRQPKSERRSPLSSFGDFFRGMALMGRIAAGKAPQKPEEKKQGNGTMTLDGMNIDAVKAENENAQAGEEHPGIAPREWSLVKLTGGGWEAVVPGVVDYAFAGENIVVSNGKYVLEIQPDGKKKPLAKAEGVIRMAVME